MKLRTIFGNGETENMNNEQKNIVFNKPYMTGRETDYIKEAVKSLKISGDGMFTAKCHEDRKSVV